MIIMICINHQPWGETSGKVIQQKLVVHDHERVNKSRKLEEGDTLHQIVKSEKECH